MKDEIKNKLLKMVENNYEEIAEDFSATRNYVWPELRRVIARSEATWQSRAVNNITKSTELLRPEVSGLAMTVLDLGCGNGRLAELFANKNIKYTGVEQSVKLAQTAKEQIAKLKINGEIITKDILNLDKITDEKFDIILCIAVLPHIPSVELRLKLLRQIKNHLSSDGILIITVWNLRAQWKYKKLIWQYNAQRIFGLNKMDFDDIIFSGFQNHSPRYYHAFRAWELRRLLAQAGFKIKELYADKNNIYAVCS